MPKYPGLGLPLGHNDEPATGFYPIGAHSSCSGATSDPLPVREVAMMNIMERLTDKNDWHKKVFDEQVVCKWRKETLEIPDKDLWSLATSGKQQLFNEDGSVTVQESISIQGVDPLEGIMTETVFDYCVEELRRKALYYEKSGIIPTLDAYASVAKSDKLVTPELHEKLRDAFETLQKDQATSPDWHPNSNDIVQDLVHPSMYPLVYGRSKVLTTESVGVKDAINKWASKGDVIEKESWHPDQDGRRIRYRIGDGIPHNYWSDTYQWLPANVAFQDDGSVKFTSYINNLHPTKYTEIYRTIEELITASLPAWDQCLSLNVDSQTREGAGRMHSRFSTSMPGNMDDENPDIWIPSDPQETANARVDWDELARERRFCYRPKWDDETDCKWKVLRQPRIPEPAVEGIEYSPDQKVLIDRFRESGLQVIVKMASIELTLDKPEFPVGGWHVEGQMNENICATALYYLDSENITPSNLSFRMQTRNDLDDDSEYSVGQSRYHWMERVYGTCLSSISSPCLQNYGTVETREGRLLAFPNVFQHRVSPIKLIDSTKPGHRRFIALWLVDPNRRIISTANVPPQQRSWWLGAILGSTPESRNAAMSKIPPEIISLIDEKRKGTLSAENDTKYGEGIQARLPPELMEMVRGYFEEDQNALLMGSEEANEHRLKLMEERSKFVKTSEEDWQESSYNFCEH